MSAQYYHLALSSKNAKTGPIACSTTSRSSCPTSCAFRGRGCYAESGPLSMFWRKLSDGLIRNALSFDEFIDAVQRLPDGQLWRHNQAGDLPGAGDDVDAEKLLRLAKAASHTAAWTYTHKPLSDANVAAMRSAVDAGFTINISADRPGDVDAMIDSTELPVVTVLPSDFDGKVLLTTKCRRIVRCPATWRDDVTCSTCGNGRPLCQRADRDYAIGFPAHGAARRKADAVVDGQVSDEKKAR